jgi:hypothetical protein
MIPFDALAKLHPSLAPGFRALDAYLAAHPGTTEFTIGDVWSHCRQFVSLAELCVALAVLEKRNYIVDRYQMINLATMKPAPETFGELEAIPDVLTDESGVKFDAEEGELRILHILIKQAAPVTTA